MQIKEKEDKDKEREDKEKEDKDKEREDKEKEDKEREDKDKEDKQKEDKKRKKEIALKEYSKIVNYPGMNVTMQTITETDDELFGNLFNETHVIYQNNLKRYLFCSTFFILYAIIAYMYYYFIYSN